MRFLAATALTAFLAGCAMTSPIEPPPPGGGGVAAFATLAPEGTLEWRASPAYTGLAAARHQAAKNLRKRRITVDQAKAAQALADAIRSDLDRAVGAKDTAALAAAEARIPELRKLAGG